MLPNDLHAATMNDFKAMSIYLQKDNEEGQAFDIRTLKAVEMSRTALV